MTARLVIALALAASCAAAGPTPTPDPRREEARALEAVLTQEEDAPHEDDAEAWLGRNERLRALYQDLGDRDGEVGAMIRLGLAHDHLDQPAAGVRWLQAALEQSRTEKRRRREVEVLNWLGFVHLRRGDYQPALEHLQDGLAKAKARRLRALHAPILTNLGSLYGYLKDERQALRCYLEALALSDDARSANTVGLLHNIGTSYVFLEEPAKALPYFRRALAGWRALRDHASEGMTLTLMAQLHLQQGRSDESLRELGEALRLVKAAGNREAEVSTLLELGYVYENRNDTENARTHYDRAYELLKTLDTVGRHEMFWRLPQALARLAAGEGRYDEARRWLDVALSVVEASRTTLSTRALRALFSASVEQAYATYVDVLMRQHAAEPDAGHDRAALEMSERSRARTLVEMLSSAHIDLDASLDPALAQQAKRLHETLDAKAALQMRRFAEGDTEAGRRLDEEIRQATADLELTLGQIRERDPRYGGIVQPQPIRASEIQDLMDDDTALVELALGKERSWAFVVTPSAIRAVALPAQAEITALAQRVHTLAVARNRPRKEEGAAARLAAVAAADRDFRRVAAALSEAVLGPLPRPAAKRLVIVPDGALHTVPFAALPAPRTWDLAPGAPLIARYEVTALPSAAVVAELRRPRPGPTSSTARLMVFADPVFDRSDARVAANGQGARTSVVQAGVPSVDFPRLSLTGALANEAALGVPRGLARKAVGFEANRTLALSEEMAAYRTVLFATHGVLNHEHPELSGVVLSLVDKSGAAQNGFLRLHDIYDMKLDADLVVLAACETGLGKEMKGEGLVGLSRGFMYAGARRVVSALWKVDEEATTELIRAFLRGVLRDGKPHPAALREAQEAVRRQPRWRAPYFWAGFALQGEWR
jgi:CHAT domain-containing protein/tetratricopeptide (TPR) repeat protein